MSVMKKSDETEPDPNRAALPIVRRGGRSSTKTEHEYVSTAVDVKGMSTHVLLIVTSIVLDGEVRRSGGVESGITPAVNVPRHSLGRDPRLRHPNPQVRIVVDVQPVEGGHHTWDRLERLVEADGLAVDLLRLVPRTDVHRVVRARRNVGPVGGMSDPRRGAAVEGRVSPSVDVEREAGGRDIGDVGLDAPVVVLVDIELVEPDDHLGRRAVRLREGDMAERRRLGLIPGMVVYGGELSVLEVTIVGADIEPGAAGGVERGVTPGVEVDFDGGRLDRIRIRLDANVGVTVDVEQVQADGERHVMARKGFIDGVLELRLVPEANLRNFSRSISHHTHGTSVMIDDVQTS